MKLDTICLDMSTFQKVMIAAEEKKVLSERIELFREQERLMNARIRGLDSTISTYKWKDDNSKTIISALEYQMKIYQQELGLLLDQIAKSNKEVKKQKRKTFLTALAGVAATVAALFL